MDLESTKPVTGRGIQYCSHCNFLIEPMAYIRRGTKRARCTFISDWHLPGCEWVKKLYLRRQRMEAMRRAVDRFDAQRFFSNL